MAGFFIWSYYLFHKYYFFGKMAIKNQRNVSFEENERRAQMNKRNFGFGLYYEPTLKNSRKKLILETLGDNYDRAAQFEDRLLDIATFEELQAQID
jgi:hypothetical protein